jgi:hypothetical protein
MNIFLKNTTEFYLIANQGLIILVVNQVHKF